MLLTLGAEGAWAFRFGRLGPTFNTDVAVHGAMVLRPIDAHFLYYWGQTRLGSVVPAIGKLVHAAFGTGGAESAQLAVYLCDGLALLLALRLLRTWPAKILFFVLVAFPADGMARAMLAPGQPLPGLFLFAMLEIRALTALIESPSARRAAIWGLSCGALIWAGDPGLALLGAQIPVLLVALRRRPARSVSAVVAGTVLGIAVPAALIVGARLAGHESPLYRRFLHPGEILRSLANLGPSLRPLEPALGALVLPLVAAGLAVAAVLTVRRWAREGGAPAPLALVGIAPAVGLIVIACSRWFEVNGREPRYLSFPTLLALLSLSLFLDEQGEKNQRWATILAAVGALGLAVLFAAVNLRTVDSDKDAGDRWRARTRWIENVGCSSVVGGYWDSYPYFTLSEGRLPATPREGDFVREPSLAQAAVRAPVVCAIPWWDADTDCPATLEQFGARLRFQDELIGHVSVGAHLEEAPLRVCRYVPGA